MVRICNQINYQLQDYLQGLVNSQPHLKQVDQSPILYCLPKAGQIPIISGGGSGHEPAHAGFVGQGMLTAAVSGPIFVPPSSQDILTAIRHLDQGQGVFLIIKNFEADLQAFSQAIKEARSEGRQVKYVVSHDDISVETSTFQVRHRGLAGTILLHKILGQASLEGASLDQLEELGLAITSQTATIGFATKPPHLPGQDQPLFDLPDHCISYGIGIHGEDGYRTVPFQSSENLAIEIVNKLKLAFRWQEGEDFILLVNNLGTSTDLEQTIFLNDLIQLLQLEGLNLPFIKNGRYMTSLDMAGISVTLCRLADQKWLDYLTAPCQAQAW